MAKRSLSKNEKISLWLKSNGYCCLCGERIRLNSFHADHIVPYSMGGPTEALNMQATCKACNLSKGKKSMKDFTSSRFPNARGWQKDCFDQASKFFVANSELKNLAISVSPGGGKTIFALMAWDALKRSGVCKKIVVIVPSRDLFRQWQRQAQRFGFRISGTMFDIGDPGIDGVVLTYQAVCSSPNTFIAACQDSGINPHFVFLVCDEFHRVSEYRITGEKLLRAFDATGKRLLMSGTFFRTDKKGMPWIEYDKEGNPVTLFDYSMPDAIRDGVLREPEFLHLNGNAVFSDIDDDGEEFREEIQYSEAELKDESQIIANLVNDPDNLRKYMQNAVDKLSACKKINPSDKGGIVVSNVNDAYRVQSVLEQMGVKSTVVVTPGERDFDDNETDVSIASSELNGKETDNGRLMDEFRAGNGGDFIISVAMLREGTDLPDWRVMVYLSRCRALLSFYQFIARCMRIRCNCQGDSHYGSCDHATGANKAFVFIPELKSFLARAADVFNAVKLAKRTGPKLIGIDPPVRTLFDQTRFLIGSQSEVDFGSITKDDSLKVDLVKSALEFTKRIDLISPAKSVGEKLRGMLTHAEIRAIQQTVDIGQQTVTTTVFTGRDEPETFVSSESPEQERKHLNKMFNTYANRVAHKLCENRRLVSNTPEYIQAQSTLRNKVVYTIHTVKLGVKDWDNKKQPLSTLKKRNELVLELERNVIRGGWTDV